MNDRFKFRVYDGKKIHYDDFVVTATGYIASIDDYDGEYCFFDQSDFTADREYKLMQCTGLKDKNGVLIYEGDICSDNNGELYQAYYYEQDIAICLKSCDGGIMRVCPDVIDLKIIGNIYENPELLEDN